MADLVLLAGTDSASGTETALTAGDSPTKLKPKAEKKYGEAAVVALEALGTDQLLDELITHDDFLDITGLGYLGTEKASIPLEGGFNKKDQPIPMHLPWAQNETLGGTILSTSGSTIAYMASALVKYGKVKYAAPGQKYKSVFARRVGPTEVAAGTFVNVGAPSLPAKKEYDLLAVCAYIEVDGFAVAVKATHGSFGPMEPGCLVPNNLTLGTEDFYHGPRWFDFRPYGAVMTFDSDEDLNLWAKADAAGEVMVWVLLGER